MSEENVEIVRRLWEAAARRDRAAVLAFYDPEAELDNTRGPTQQFMGARSVYHGHAGLQTFWREWHEAWENVDYDVEELIDAGEQVISVVTSRGRGRVSGVAVEFTHTAGVYTIRAGKVVRVAFFPTRGEALEAAGLSE